MGWLVLVFTLLQGRPKQMVTFLSVDLTVFLAPPIEVWTYIH